MSARAEAPWIGYAFAFGAAASYGTAAVLIREGVSSYGSPFAGVTIALVTGLVLLAPLAWRARRQQAVDWRPGRVAILFVLASGFSSLLGFSSNVFALSRLPVVVATPITSAYPLITVLLVRLFLRRHEPIRPRTVWGALFVVAGVVLVTVGRQR